MNDIDFLRTLDPTIIVGGMTLGEAINTTPAKTILTLLVAAGVIAAIAYVTTQDSMSDDERLVAFIQAIEKVERYPDVINRELMIIKRVNDTNKLTKLQATAVKAASWYVITTLKHLINNNILVLYKSFGLNPKQANSPLVANTEVALGKHNQTELARLRKIIKDSDISKEILKKIYDDDDFGVSGIRTVCLTPGAKNAINIWSISTPSSIEDVYSKYDKDCNFKGGGRDVYSIVCIMLGLMVVCIILVICVCCTYNLIQNKQSRINYQKLNCLQIYTHQQV